MFAPESNCFDYCSFVGLSAVSQPHSSVFIFLILLWLSSVQFLSHVQLFAIPQTAARQASLSITKTLELAQAHIH